MKREHPTPTSGST